MDVDAPAAGQLELETDVLADAAAVTQTQSAAIVHSGSTVSATGVTGPDRRPGGRRNGRSRRSTCQRQSRAYPGSVNARGHDARQIKPAKRQPVSLRRCDTSRVLTRLRAQLRRPWPLRLRVTFAVTGATALVLAAAGVLVYVQFGRTLDARTDAELHDRVEALSTLAARVPAQELLPDSGEPYAQVYDAAGGRLLNSTARLEEDQLLTREQVARAAQAPIDAARRGAAGG